MDVQNLPIIRSLWPKQTTPPEVVTFVQILDMVTRVALGVLAATTAPLLFAPVFVAGVAWGAYHNHHYGHMHTHAPHPSGCGQGFMESMAGMHFPHEISLLANLGITICHVDHHPEVFVPYCAVAVGMWAGQLIDKQISNIVKMIPQNI